MSKNDNKQWLEKVYRPLPRFPIEQRNTALLVTDMQYFDAARGYGMFAQAEQSGITHVLDYYGERLEQMVVPNIQRLLRRFRSLGMEVIYSRIESLTQDGRDRSRSHKMLNLHAPRGSKEGEILKELRPVGDEIVLSKTASGVFGSTNIDYLLRNMGIEHLIITGVLTNECVENAVRGAADHGYLVTVPEDATAALTPELQEASMFTLGHSYAQVLTTTDVIKQL